MAAITIQDLTEGSLQGEGVFDVLMQATKAHLQAEYEKNRLRGPEYAQVYLGGLQAVMERALQFLLQQQRVDLEAQLLAEQITTEQKNQLLLDAQLEKLQAETALIQQQTTNAVVEGTVLEAQEAKLRAEITNLEAQECKLRAEYDVLLEQKLKTVAETALLNQKKLTEQAQTLGTGVDADSVIGRQKALYQAQAEGFNRKAEQAAAKILVDSWSVRKTADPTDTREDLAGLDDSAIQAVIAKLREGISA